MIKEKMKKFWNSNKYNIYILFGMLLFTLIICSNFIKAHFALDTYCVYAHDSNVQISHFLVSNRIFSALARWLSLVLDISFFTNMKILMISGMVFLAIAWFILYKFVIKMCNRERDIPFNILIGGITFSIIFNFCTVESLLFWESGVMCFGILCAVIASCVFNSKIRHRLILTFFILYIGSSCYQGAITIFIPLSLVLLTYKNLKEIKKIIIDTLKVGIIYFFVMLLNLLATKIFSFILHNEFRETAMLSIPEMFETITRVSGYMAIDTFGIGPRYWYIFSLSLISIIFLIYIIKNKKIDFSIVEYIVLILACILTPIIPLLATPVNKQYFETRMAMSFGSSLGIILLFMYMTIKMDKYKFLNLVTTIIIFVMLMLNAMYYIRASSENMATVYMDRNIAKTIIEEIYKYQDESGNKIENIGLTFDKSQTTYYNGQPQYNAINTRSMVINWAAIETIELYSGEHFNQIEVPDKYKKIFEEKDWNFFDKDQLVFENNNLYICLY